MIVLKNGGHGKCLLAFSAKSKSKSFTEGRDKVYYASLIEFTVQHFIFSGEFTIFIGDRLPSVLKSFILYLTSHHIFVLYVKYLIFHFIFHHLYL